MSANLKNSAELAKAGWFADIIKAAVIEHALKNPTDPLAKAMVNDPAYQLPVFVGIVADHPAISADGWQGRWETDWGTAQEDIRTAVAQVWVALRDALSNVGT